MAFDYSKLRGRIMEVCGTQIRFSERMGWSQRTLSLKLNGHVAWKQDEICLAMDILGINEDELVVYFFNNKVKSIEQNCKELQMV